jgi:hypothetical protein
MMFLTPTRYARNGTPFSSELYGCWSIMFLLCRSWLQPIPSREEMGKRFCCWVGGVGEEGNGGDGTEEHVTWDACTHCPGRERRSSSDHHPRTAPPAQQVRWGEARSLDLCIMHVISTNSNAIYMCLPFCLSRHYAVRVGLPDSDRLQLNFCFRLVSMILVPAHAEWIVAQLRNWRSRRLICDKKKLDSVLGFFYQFWQVPNFWG